VVVEKGEEGLGLRWKWVSALAVIGVMAAGVWSLNGRTSPAATAVTKVVTYVDVAQDLGPTVDAWPMDDDSQDNNPVVGQVSLADGPKYLVNVPALVNSIPVLVGNELYVAGGFVSGPRNQAHPGEVWAMNPATGSVNWSVTLPNSVFSQPIVAQNVLLVGVGNAAFQRPSLAPAITPGMVRGVGPSGLYAFNATTGKKLWTFSTSGADQAPPTVAGNTVYLASGNRRLYAINLITGQPLWSVNIGHYVSRSSPRILGNVAYMGGAGPLGVVAVNLTTHRVLWQQPIVHALEGVDDTAIAVTPAHLITAALTGSASLAPSSPDHQAEIFALSPETGHILWSKIIARGVAPTFKATGTPTVVGNRVYVGNAMNGRVVCLSIETGQVLWSVATGSPVTRPPAVLDHRVYVLTKSGTLFAISAKGQIVAKENIADFVNTYGPVVYDHTLALSGNTVGAGYVAMVPLFGLPAKLA